MSRIAPLAILFTLGSGLRAQAATPPTDSALAAITTRGRALAAYDYAAWHGTDAVLALHPPPGSVTDYIARPTDSGWVVAFGHASAARDTFYIAYEALPTEPADSAHPYAAVAREDPIADTGYFSRAYRASHTARADFRGAKRPYNVAILPAPDGNWWVYLVPAPTVAGVWPLGGDVRYLISPEGNAILERRRLHNAIIEFRAPPERADGSKLEAGTHTAVLDDIPEDTDVFFVLTRTPRIPEYVVTEPFVYRIETDGVIHLVARHE